MNLTVLICLIIYFCADLRIICEDIEQEDFLIFKYPNQPINTPNFTIAALFPVKISETQLDFDAASSLMTTICEVDKYNLGTGQVPVKGTFNLMIYASDSEKGSLTWTLLRRVLGQNLYYVNDSKTFGDVQDTPLNSIIRQTTLRKLGLDAGMLSGVGMAAIEYISDDRFYEDDGPFKYPSRQSAMGAILISQTSAYVISLYMFATFKYFNWSLVGAIFSTGLSGFVGQDAFQNINNNNAFSAFSFAKSLFRSINQRAVYPTDHYA